MTKRFTYSKKPHYYGNIIDNGKMLKYTEVVDLLNELHEEIMTLRREHTQNKLILFNIIQDLGKQANTKEPIIIGTDYIEWIKQNTYLNIGEKPQ